MLQSQQIVPLFIYLKKMTLIVSLKYNIRGNDLEFTQVN